MLLVKKKIWLVLMSVELPGVHTYNETDWNPCYRNLDQHTKIVLGEMPSRCCMTCLFQSKWSDAHTFFILPFDTVFQRHV